MTANPISEPFKPIAEMKCEKCGELIDVQPGETYRASTDGRVWHYGCAPSARNLDELLIEEQRNLIAALQDKIRRLEEALSEIVRLERSIKIDIGATHNARQLTTSHFQRDCDASFRIELETAFTKARTALTDVGGG